MEFFSLLTHLEDIPASICLFCTRMVGLGDFLLPLYLADWANLATENGWQCWCFRKTVVTNSHTLSAFRFFVVYLFYDIIYIYVMWKTSSQVHGKTCLWNIETCHESCEIQPGRRGPIQFQPGSLCSKVFPMHRTRRFVEIDVFPEPSLLLLQKKLPSLRIVLLRISHGCKGNTWSGQS